jgi:dipeptidyl aminopeptidase/acylaminoacyl peptidase
LSKRPTSWRLAPLCLLGGWLALQPARAPAAEARGGPRLLGVDDYFAIADVDDPQISPDGYWIAYTVTTASLDDDDTRSRIWMVPAAGGSPVPLTDPDQDSSSPRWSPDGRFLAFLSSRGGDDADVPTQVWTLFRGGGEAVQRTHTAQDVRFFAWSPDSSKLLLVLKDPTPEELAAKAARDKGEPYEPKTAPPWVIRRRQFKQDYVGYLESRWNHLYVQDVASGKLKQITSGDTDDYCQAYLPGCDNSEPAWSPDGKRVAFVSNRTADPDADYNTDIWVVDADNADRGAKLLQITKEPGPDAAPSWSPDGRWIAHTSNTETGAALYGTFDLAVSPADGSGGTRRLTRQLDRMVFRPRFSRRDDSIYFLLEDSGEQDLARVSASGGAVERLVSGPRTVRAFHEGPSGEIATLVSEPHLPGEVFLWKDGNLKPSTHVNDELMNSLLLGPVEKIRFQSKDGTPVEAFVVKPPGSPSGRQPGILLIHGGPQAQYDYGFDFDAQLYAAQGYVVVLPNPRGSTGYGEDFCRAIWQDWGGPDYEDVMAAVDAAIARGWVDPERMAVTGWSYGGMLTDHVITRTDRFKAAATGASAVLYVTNFGHDQYQRWWVFELGEPWKPEARAIYERMSPFNRVDKVVTPTLILGGEEDWNVPIANSEQLYLALKIRGVPTELVVYPGEYHGINKPSHIKDLYGRYLEWFDRYLHRGGKPRAE